MSERRDGPRSDDALRAFHRDLEAEAHVDAAFSDSLFLQLDAGRRPAGLLRRPSFVLLAAALGVTAVAAGVLVAALVQLPRHPRQTASPGRTVAVSSADDTPATTDTATPTRSPTPPASATPTPSPSPTATPSTPTPSPEFGLDGTWSQNAAVPRTPAARISDTELGPDGRIYAIFENLNGAMAAYEPDADRWTMLDTDGQLPYGVSTDAELETGVDGLIYLFMWGAEYTDVFVYDPRAQAWTTEPAYQLADQVVLDAAAASDGRFYFVSGTGRPDGPTTMTAFDRTDGSVTSLATIEGAYGPSIETASDGRLYVIGDDGLVSYDPGSKSWRVEYLEPGESVGQGHFAGGPGGLVYVVGLHSHETDGPMSLLAWRIGGDGWLTMPPLDPPMESGTLVVAADGRLYVVEERTGRDIARRVMSFTPD